jgi:hypothetical protein
LFDALVSALNHAVFAVIAALALTGLPCSGQSRITVPTGYREDTQLPLKVLSIHTNASPFVAAITRIQSGSAAFDNGVPRARLRTRIAACHAFKKT